MIYSLNGDCSKLIKLRVQQGGNRTLFIRLDVQTNRRGYLRVRAHNERHGDRDSSYKLNRRLTSFRTRASTLHIHLPYARSIFPQIFVRLKRRTDKMAAQTKTPRALFASSALYYIEAVELSRAKF